MGDTDAVAALMQANLIEIFGERDSGLRRAAMSRTYVQDVAFTDPEGTVHGYDAIDAQIRALHSKAPDTFGFSTDGPLYLLDTTTAALAWSFGPAGGPAAVRGIDVATISGGRITSIQTLLAN